MDEDCPTHLVNAAVADLRRQRISIPRISVIERLCFEVRGRARACVCHKLTDDLSPSCRHRLDALLTSKVSSGISHLSWLRQFPQTASARNLIGLTERVKFRRAPMGADPYQAIEETLPWDRFEVAVEEAEALTRRQSSDVIGRLGTSVRHLAPLCAGLHWGRSYSRAFPAVSDLIKAINLLDEMNVLRQRKLPANVPTSFVSRRWWPYVFRDGKIDRRYYEMVRPRRAARSIASRRCLGAWQPTVSRTGGSSTDT